MPRRTDILRLAILLAAVVLVGVLAYRQYLRLSGASQQVWVAKVNLGPGATVTRKVVKVESRRVKDLPPDTVFDIADLEGRQLLRAKPAGEVFSADDFVTPAPAQQLSAVIPEGRVLYTLNVRGVAVPHEQLVSGDRLEIIAVGAGAGRGAGRVVAHDAIVLGYVRPPLASQPRRGLLDLNLAESPRARRPSPDFSTPPLVLAVRPEDVFPLAELRPTEQVAVVLHGRHEVERGELLPLAPTRTTSSVEVLIGARRMVVDVP